MLNRTIQIKLVKDESSVARATEPQTPENSVETKVVEVASQVSVLVVLGYTACKSVDFLYRMAEHTIVNR